MKINSTRVLLKTVLYVILFTIIFEMMLFGYAQYNHQLTVNNLYPSSESLNSQIETIFQNTLTISDGYLSYINSNIDATQEETETFLGHLFSYDENYIKNIALIEDTTIKYNYPFEENQSSIGVDLATIDGQSEDILRVKNNLESVFIGPVDLVQGGTAFIIRIPILNDGEYWGQIAVVVDADQFGDILISVADENDIYFTIHDRETDTSILEYGNILESHHSLDSTYTNKYFEWNVAIYEDTSSEPILFPIVSRIIGYALLFTLGYFIYRYFNKDEVINYNAKHDSLTGLYNRAQYTLDFQEGLFKGMLIAFADVNKFKLLNDTLGHSFGDWCLIQLSNQFKEYEDFRTYRISGDEFILVSKIPMTIEQFRTEFTTNKFSFYSEEFKQNIDIDLAVGILEELQETISIESILMYLDYAMYDAKKENKWLTVVNQSLMELYDNTKVIEQQLIDDIKNNNLIPYYQPIINLETKKIEGFEVLSRWLYKGEIRSAAMFISTVKKIKYVDLVDKNLFRKLEIEYQELIKGCKEIQELSFSINLSAETLMIYERNRERFDVLVKNDIIPKEKIIFEISEDMNLGLISIETLRYMQDKGYFISIDDFGAGVSKLTDVLSGEIKTIKTDKSLLPDAKKKDRKTEAFYTIINAIKASGTTICVEGVETKSQLNIAIDAGCKLAQGYYFSKPIPKDQVIAFVRTFNIDEYM